MPIWAERAATKVAMAAAALALLAGVVACSSGGDATTTGTTETTTTMLDVMVGRPHGVTTRQLTLVDTSRPTPEGAGGPAEASRTIGVWLTLPEVEGPVPLVVFSHGMAGHPRKFEQLARTWAEAGYAVAAPAFPRSNADAPSSFGNLYDVANQPGDVSFVLDELLAMSADPSSELAGRFDPERIGAAGLSAGGWTTYRVAVDPTTRDPRIVAAIAMSAPGQLGAGGLTTTTPVPVLVMHGDRDPLVVPASVVATYDSLSPPKRLVTLLGAGHAGEFEDAEDALEPKVPGQDELIASVTVAFWDRYLLDDTTAEARIAAAGAQPAIATYQESLR